MCCFAWHVTKRFGKILLLRRVDFAAFNAKGEGMSFADTEEVQRAYGSGRVELHARVKVRIHETLMNLGEETTEQTRIVETTVGRALLWDIVPAGLSFDMINQPMVKKSQSRG